MTDLPKLRRDVKITDRDYPSQTFHQWWDRFARSLGADLTDMETAIAALQALGPFITGVSTELARTNSYPNPTNVLTAADVGSTATITIAAHTRVYPVRGPYQIEDVAITGGTITGLSFSTAYHVYYDDETLTNTAPTYVATTTAATAQVGAAAGRHYLGVITTPADGAGGTSGTGPKPPGGGGPI